MTRRLAWLLAALLALSGCACAQAEEALAIDEVVCDVSLARVGDTVTWTARASGGMGGYTYFFEVYMDARVVANSGRYASDESFSYRVEAAGAYRVRAYVRDAARATAFLDGGPVAAEKENLPLSVKSVACDVAQIEVGGETTWRIAAQGGEGEYSHYFRVFRGDKVVYESEAYGESDTLVYTPEKAGRYTVCGFVKDATGTRKALTSAVLSVVKEGRLLTVASLSASREEAGIGDTLTWTAKAEGGDGDARYYFVVLCDGEKLLESENYGKTAKFSCKAEKQGVYSARVFAKDEAGVRVSIEGAPVRVLPSGEDVAIESLKADVAQAELGETIVWRAVAPAVAGTVKYRFELYRGETPLEEVDADTLVFSHTPAELGAYWVRLTITRADGTDVEAKSSRVAVYEAGGKLAIASVTPDRGSVQAGGSIAWTAQATGGRGAYRYAFELYKNGERVQQTTEYGESAVFTARMDEPGSYMARAYVRDGEGTTNFANSANAIAYASVVDVAAGERHTLALLADGSVAVAGDASLRQLDVSGWRGVTQVAAGSFHSVGLLKDGTVLAAGADESGETKVEDWNDIVQVAAGCYITIGLKADGTVLAAGYDYMGACDVGAWTEVEQVDAGLAFTAALLKDGTVQTRGSFSGDTSAWTDIVQIAAGLRHLVGLRADGTLVATGVNDDGQCDVGEWTDIVQIAAGTAHTLGLRRDGTVAAAGANGDGRCDVSEWNEVTGIAAGGHSLAMCANGDARAAGANDYGQIDISNWEVESIGEAYIAPLGVSVEADTTSARVGDTVTWTASASGGVGPYDYYFIVYRNGEVLWESAAYTADCSCEIEMIEPGPIIVYAYARDHVYTKALAKGRVLTVRRS